MKRRQFLETLTIGAGAAAVWPVPASGAEPNCTFPADPRGRIAVASYPFRNDLSPRTGKMKLLDFPKMIVDRYNIHGIEPLDQHFTSLDPAYLAQFREALAKANSHVVNIPVGLIKGSFYDPNEQKRKSAIASARTWVDVGKAVGSPGIRVHVAGPKGMSQDVSLTAAV